MEQRHEELLRLSEAAHRLLEDATLVPDAPPVKKRLPLLRVWHFPSFEIHRSWTLFEPLPHVDLGFLVRQVSWDRPRDAERLTNPLVGLERGFDERPTIEFEDREPSREEVETRLQPLREITLPIYGVNQTFGVDGETTGIELERDRVRLSWQDSAPAEWSTLEEWVLGTRTWLAKLFAG